MSKISNSMFDLIQKNSIDDVRDLFKKTGINKEFEFILFNYNKKYLGLEKYISLIKFMNIRSRKMGKMVVKQNQLDIVYNSDGETNYRITIEGIDNINNNIEQLHKYKNHVIFSTFVTRIIENDKQLSINKKIKSKDNVVDLDEINTRVRLSEELLLSKTELVSLQKISHTEESKITFRMKDRVSYYIDGDDKTDQFIKIDMTVTKMSKYINKINDAIPNYELEIEYITNKTPKMESLDRMFKEIESLLKVVQASNYIVTNSIEKYVLTEYSRIIGIEPDKIISLDARQPLSLEIQHVTETLPNRYAVTDKADGERYFLIIIDGQVYFISTNLAVKRSGIQLPKNMNKYNNTILDGELIFIPSKNRYLYMAFDCLYNGDTNVKTEVDFLARLKNVDEIIKACFVTKNQKGYVMDDYKSNKEYNIDNIISFHDKQLKNYMQNINLDLDIEKEYPLIRRKYFLPVSGAKSWEIFKYSAFLWDKYSNDSAMKFPYLLDGLIYHPLEQAYITSAKDSKLFEYKWKPPEKNSIDFYISFEKDRDTGKTLTVYDNSIDDHVKNKSYKICNLYVGKKGKFGEQPTLFREENGGYITHLFLKNGEPVDVDNNLINDNTVVEFYYKNDPELDERYQWIPIRTRYDKTESVLKHRKKYGNYIDVANKVWRSIINPILMTDFEDLAKGNDEKTGIYNYDKKINSLRNKIGHDLIVSTTRENVYFQKTSNIAKSMRQFHNWVKSIIIYTHCHPMYQHNKSLSVLDIACGKGQDIMKFYYSKVAKLVGVDVDRDALTSATDGAESRYAKFRRSKPGFPKMYFIQADVGALLNYEDQFRALKGMSNENRNTFNQFFSIDDSKKSQFDRINCQFALHYFLKNTDTWNNFKQNLRDYLKPAGYFLASTYDAHRVAELFKDSDKYTVHYTNDKGDKKILFELVKKFPDFKKDDVIGVANPLDVHVSWFMQEGNYMTEYLVDENFVKKELLEDCDLELVDTGMFDELFEMHREYFMKYAQYEENPETRKFLLNVKEYYDDRDDVNRGCYLNTRLTRYYVFRKKDKSKNKKQKGGGIDFDNTERYVMPKINGESSCCSSIHNLLIKHKLIPKTLTSQTLFSDLNIPHIKDADLTQDYLKNLSKSLYVYHENDDEVKQKIFDGINIIVVEKDCNGDFDFDVYEKSKPKKNDKAIILYKEQNGYKPIYRKEVGKDTIKGIFTYGDPMIQDILENYL